MLGSEFYNDGNTWNYLVSELVSDKAIIWHQLLQHYIHAVHSLSTCNSVYFESSVMGIHDARDLFFHLTALHEF